MKRSILILVSGLLFATASFAQTAPPLKPRSDDKFTQTDSYLQVLKGLGIPSGSTNTLTGVGTRVNLFYNTTEGKLKIYDGLDWKDASPADFSDYYTKAQIDAGFVSVLGGTITQGNSQQVSIQPPGINVSGFGKNFGIGIGGFSIDDGSGFLKSVGYGNSIPEQTNIDIMLPTKPGTLALEQDFLPRTGGTLNGDLTTQYLHNLTGATFSNGRYGFSNSAFELFGGNRAIFNSPDNSESFRFWMHDNNYLSILSGSNRGMYLGVDGTLIDAYSNKKYLKEGDAAPVADPNETFGYVQAFQYDQHAAQNGSIKMTGGVQGSFFAGSHFTLTGGGGIETINGRTQLSGGNIAFGKPGENSETLLLEPYAGNRATFKGELNGTDANFSGSVNSNDFLIRYGTGTSRKIKVETGAGPVIDVFKYDNYSMYFGNTNADNVTGDIHIQGNGTDAFRISNTNDIFIADSPAPVVDYKLLVRDVNGGIRQVEKGDLGAVTYADPNGTTHGGYVWENIIRADNGFHSQNATLTGNSTTNEVTLSNGSAGSINLNGYTVNIGYNLSVANDINVAGKVQAPAFRLSALQTAPASANDSGNTGDIRVTSDYIYVCIATNQWVRSALTTW